MSKVRIFQRENRLRRLVETPGGKPLPDAVRDATLAMESVSDETVAAIDLAVDCLKSAAREAPASLAAQRTVYAQASIVAGLAATCGLPGLGQVAFSLCELADRQMLNGQWSSEAAQVHLDAMVLLRRPDMARSEAARASVLNGLAKVLARVPKPGA
jgi:hypothetical protein